MFIKTWLLGFAFLICLCSAMPVFSQALPSIMAQLAVSGKSLAGQTPFITINGQNSVDGSSLVSPAQISVPSATTAVIDFGKAGKMELASGTSMSLTFDTTGVSVELREGRLQITSAPEFVFNVKTIDGTIANDPRGKSAFLTEIVGGATGVSTATGIALVNGVPVRAGKAWTADPAKKALLTKKALAAKSPKTTASGTTKSSHRSKLRLLGLGAAISAGVIITIVAIKNN